MKNATWMRLKSGQWGLRVFGEDAQEGEAVVVTKRDGSAEEKTIARVLWSGKGLAICAVERTPYRRDRDDDGADWRRDQDGIASELRADDRARDDGAAFKTDRWGRRSN